MNYFDECMTIINSDYCTYDNFDSQLEIENRNEEFTLFIWLYENHLHEYACKYAKSNHAVTYCYGYPDSNWEVTHCNF